MDPRGSTTCRSRVLRRAWRVRRNRARAGFRNRRRTREPWPLPLRLVLEGHSRTLRAPRKVAMPHLPDRLARFVLAQVDLGAAELAAPGQRLAVCERDGE